MRARTARAFLLTACLLVGGALASTAPASAEERAQSSAAIAWEYVQSLPRGEAQRQAAEAFLEGYAESPQAGAASIMLRTYQAEAPVPAPGQQPEPSERTMGEVEAPPGERQRVASASRAVSAPELLTIPGGTMRLGRPGYDTSDGRRAPDDYVEVTLSDFRIMAAPVTFDEFNQRARFVDGVSEMPDFHGWGRGDRPVLVRRFTEADAYARWLSEQTGQRFRLPTMAELEYAARYDDPERIDDIYLSVLDRPTDRLEETLPVSRMPASASGLRGLDILDMNEMSCTLAHGSQPYADPHRCEAIDNFMAPVYGWRSGGRIIIGNIVGARVPKSFRLVAE
ncbi:formylglycine-generating enzyme required for sulfatase activity [Natronocella acetinitrilica]|uniref:Formylglycine-generating enzyme required for sulfatase activity n=1 Tax=Natronocella acetinitrilica TaxID=414046 RepID=A0AAE3G311_9GAMM|nr:formylglycine-generating enzyme family protein [Natronocella acetinitrilica]MCP1674114.1 formylglycine-generating enzyme required for sulfatase activity [Natronocella acetinitrilica]